MFKIGDKVRILSDGAEHSVVEEGSEGEVILLDVDDEWGHYNVQMEDGLIQFFFDYQMEKVV